MSDEDCRCHLCRPEDLDDERDRKVLRDVQEHGCHVVLVDPSITCDHDHAEAEPHEAGPAFAYSVGLWHHARHPEIAISGLRREVMHGLINDCVSRVRAGHRIEPGDVTEALLSKYPVTFETVTDDMAREAGSWSHWFHRRRVPVVQAVWTDAEGRFPWQIGTPDWLRERQPEAWRVPGPRNGCLAVDAAWPLDEDPGSKAFGCSHVVEEGAAAVWVERDLDPERGSEWTVACAAAEHDSSMLRVVHLRHLVVQHASFAALRDLPFGWFARRSSAWDPWDERGPLRA